ncbi:MAG: hypothetical protein V8Q79_06845 [Christensenellales bacterium]
MAKKVHTTLVAHDGALQPLGEKARNTPCGSANASLGRTVNDARVSDHHAIIPTGKKAANLSLTADERRLYEHRREASGRVLSELRIRRRSARRRRS